MFAKFIFIELNNNTPTDFKKVLSGYCCLPISPLRASLFGGFFDVSEIIWILRLLLFQQLSLLRVLHARRSYLRA